MHPYMLQVIEHETGREHWLAPLHITHLEEVWMGENNKPTRIGLSNGRFVDTDEDIKAVRAQIEALLSAANR